MARRMARRLGLRGNQMVLVALLAAVGLAAAVGITWQARGQGFVIERRGGELVADEGSGEDASADTPATSAGGDEGAQELLRYFVHVDGAVASPGVVELTGNDLRVYDAVQAAGGLLDDADTSAVNLAEPLADGAKIHIPREGEDLQASATPVGGQAQTSGATGSGNATVLVNINTATSEELQTLTGVGEATAKAIIDERERNGPFASIEDLMRVSGIGEKKFEKLREDICV